jgi:muramoyltetrapeptide carboxypeptidase
MNRKNFLSSLAGIGALVPGIENEKKIQYPAMSIIPPYLKKGDTVGITSPAGFITLKDLQPAILQMTNWELKIRIGATIGKKNFGFGGTDDERADDLQNMLDDPSIDAIMCARGGYGVVRIIDRLNFTKFKKYPKWIIGFSDVTVLHSHINRNFGIASIHSKMCNSFPDDWNTADEFQKQTILSIRNALMGEPIKYNITPSVNNKPGIGEGMVVGGNLKTIESLAGTDSDLYTNGKILFVEDTGEYLYSIDRMFYNLKRTGKLVGLQGLIIGGFKVKPDDPGEEFGIAIQDIILDKLKDLKFPVSFDFPVGHQPDNFALKAGIKHKLIVNNNSCTLEETI